MGVEYFLVCETCKEYIDCHKSPIFEQLKVLNFPPTGPIENRAGVYWQNRGTWFLLKHIGHQVEIASDHDDDWYDREPYLKEVAKP